MDAISFVLGIKSSHLRSTQLRDLVYRGRVYRTSKINADGTATEGGAEETQTNGHTNGDAGSDEESTQRSTQRDDAKTAWVMAVYEDDAGDEQKWKRTITNTGTSEYRINNRQVSAKQYNEVLEAENILVKARNFLVFQGDVEAIAQQNPKDLTRLIEQISGSLEYKEDYERLKLESEKAEEDQTFKLSQRRAMNSEIKQYQEQKREAENFERKAIERDEAIVAHVLWKLYHLQKAIEDSKEQISYHKSELQEAERKVRKYKQTFDDAQRDQAKTAREVSKLQRNIDAKEKAIAEKENSLDPIEEKIAISNRNLAKYQGRIAEITKERDAHSNNLDGLNKNLATVDKAQKRWEQERQQQQQQQGRQLSAADLQEYDRLRTEVVKLTALDQSRLESYGRQLRTDKETVESLQSKFESTQAEVQKLEDDIGQIRVDRSKFDAQVKQTQKEIDGKKKEINNLTSERTRTAQARTELEEKLQETLRKLDEANSGRRESEKDRRTRETVADMKRLFPGVLGRVRELCKPKQKKYESAMSIALGRHFDAVVVETEKAARDCIAYLKDQRQGVLAFIPLDTIQVQAIDQSLKGQYKGMRLAIDVIDYNSSVERAMMYACGNTMVCDTLEIARDICFRKKVKGTAVTLDGSKIGKGNTMTGGQGPSEKPRQWDEVDVTNLRRMVEKLTGELAQLETTRSQRKGAEEEQQLQAELEGLELQLSHDRDILKSLNRNLDSKKKEYDYKNSQLHEVQPKYQDQARGLEALKANIQRFKDAISAVEDEIFASFCQRLGYSNVREYESQQGTFEQEAIQKRLEFQNQKNRLENQIKFVSAQLQTTQDRITRLETDSKRDEQSIASLESEKETIQNELDVLNAELEQYNEQLSNLSEKADEKAKKVAEARREWQKRSKNVEEMQKQIAEYETIVQRNSASRYQQLRRCRIDEIKIPLTEASRPLAELPLADEPDPDEQAMDADGDVTMLENMEMQGYGIEVDFDELDEDLKEVCGFRFIWQCQRLTSHLG
jgi:structural maintenance of chromosome 1